MLGSGPQEFKLCMCVCTLQTWTILCTNYFLWLWCLIKGGHGWGILVLRKASTMAFLLNYLPFHYLRRRLVTAWLSHDNEVSSKYLARVSFVLPCFEPILLWILEVWVCVISGNYAKWNQLSIFKGVCKIMHEKPAADSAGEDWVRNSRKALTYMIQRPVCFVRVCNVFFWIIMDKQYCNLIKCKELFKTIIELVHS